MSHVETLATMDAGWMLRGCQAYYDEMKACTSYRGRFHQYYVHGETADCSQWKENFADCELWVDRADKEAALRVIAREKVRLEERLKPHINNPVWEKRESPPPDWNKPLPEYLLERQENSYLAMYAAHQEKLDNASSSELKMMEVKAKASCTIM